MRNTYKNSFLKETSISLNDLFDIFFYQVDCLQVESNIINKINAELIFIKL